MRYLAAEDVLVIHARVLDASGGLHGIRDLGLLISAMERPRQAFGGKQLYSTVFEKAAAMLESLARNHAFVDGNKRTALVATARFLWINGYELSASNKEVEGYILSLVRQKPVINGISHWLKRNSRKRSENK